MMEFVGGWCLALTFHAGGQNYGSGSSDSIPNCVRHSTLVDRTL